MNEPTKKEKPRIILYMIGHAPDAHYLPRLFESVEGLIDGVAFVETDHGECCLDEVRKAFDCDEWNECSRYGIKVFKDRESFDFSQARNRALGLARTMQPDYCMWLDCDDVVNDSDAILAALRANPDKDAYGLMYDVGDSCDNLFKMRIHKPDAFEWKGKVHEELLAKIDNPKIIVLQDCVVTHSPDEGKSNHEFHISLLEKQVKDTPNHYAYLGKEYFNLRRFKDAIPWLEKTVAVHPFAVEKYNALISLGVCYANLDDDDKAVEYWHDAIRVDPSRREAYYFISETYGKQGKCKSGLAYIACANAQIDEKLPAQHKTIYRLNGYKLHARYLQKAGLFSQALQVLAKIKTEHLDDEARQVTIECEAALKDKAIKEMNQTKGKQ